MTETEQQASAQDAENKVTLPFIITNEKQSLIAVSHSSHFVVFQSRYDWNKNLSSIHEDFVYYLDFVSVC